jgi:hypothetical protein
MRTHRARVVLASLVLAVMVFFAQGEAAAASSDVGSVSAPHGVKKHKPKHRARCRKASTRRAHHKLRAKHRRRSCRRPAKHPSQTTSPPVVVTPPPLGGGSAAPTPPSSDPTPPGDPTPPTSPYERIDLISNQRLRGRGSHRLLRPLL